MDFFKNLRTMDDLDRFEILFMRAEGIYAHGYHSHACKMAVSLAQDLLKSPPDLTLPSNVCTEATGAKGMNFFGTILGTISVTYSWTVLGQFQE